MQGLFVSIPDLEKGKKKKQCPECDKKPALISPWVAVRVIEAEYPALWLPRTVKRYNHYL